MGYWIYLHTLLKLYFLILFIRKLAVWPLFLCLLGLNSELILNSGGEEQGINYWSPTRQQQWIFKKLVGIIRYVLLSDQSLFNNLNSRFYNKTIFYTFNRIHRLFTPWGQWSKYAFLIINHFCVFFFFFEEGRPQGWIYIKCQADHLETSEAEGRSIGALLSG